MQKWSHKNVYCQDPHTLCMPLKGKFIKSFDEWSLTICKKNTSAKTAHQAKIARERMLSFQQGKPYKSDLLYACVLLEPVLKKNAQIGGFSSATLVLKLHIMQNMPGKELQASSKGSEKRSEAICYMNFVLLKLELEKNGSKWRLWLRNTGDCTLC